MTKHFQVRGDGIRRPLATRRVVHAVDDVTLSLAPGEIVAVVGESGSGKTTLGRLMSRLESPTSGTLNLRGQAAPTGGSRVLRSFRREVQVVFQDPYASLNPMHTLGYHLERPLLIHGVAKSKREARTMAAEMLDRVHLSPGRQYVDRYPQQLSGGQRQRVAIARALAVNPAVIVADEPVASLDVSIRLGILNLFAELTRSGCALLYITHDIASARYFADRILVMYAGQVVEEGTAELVTASPQHPYTQLLVESAPDPERRAAHTPLATRVGEVASLIEPPAGCRFHPRCPYVMPICSHRTPPLIPASPIQRASCWLLDDTHSEPDAAALVDHTVRVNQPPRKADS